jgi:hypothetical protein
MLFDDSEIVGMPAPSSPGPSSPGPVRPAHPPSDAPTIPVLGQPVPFTGRADSTPPQSSSRKRPATATDTTSSPKRVRPEAPVTPHHTPPMEEWEWEWESLRSP